MDFKLFAETLKELPFALIAGIVSGIVSTFLLGLSSIEFVSIFAVVTIGIFGKSYNDKLKKRWKEEKKSRDKIKKTILPL
ncbi:hypothetical protein KKA15_01800 [Patescibacteria group bacterium]|nr:hypothetical protein [Patescibacteria group bacterium]